MAVHDLNDYFGNGSPPGATTTTCMACGVTEPFTGQSHHCAVAADPRRRRRREMAAKRLRRLHAKLGLASRVLVACDYCGQDIVPDEPHACRPAPRPLGPPFSSQWLTGDSWRREAPPIAGGIYNTTSNNT